MAPLGRNGAAVRHVAAVWQQQQGGESVNSSVKMSQVWFPRQFPDAQIPETFVRGPFQETLCLVAYMGTRDNSFDEVIGHIFVNSKLMAWRSP